MGHEEDLKDNWFNREPWIVQDPGFQREWLVPEPLRYYLTQDGNGEWSVCDRWLDIPEGVPQPTREKAIREFYKRMGREIPSGTKLPTFENSKHH
jgi:hypothetical protein